MASTQPPETRHRLAVRILVVLATILAFLAIFTSWIDRQALDTDQWVDTSGRLLEDKEISDALATYSVDQLYASVDVARILKKQLPPDLQPVSSPLAAGVREFATRAGQQAFQSPRVQTLWADANRVAHTQLVSILKGNNQAITSQNGKVVLDLRPIVLQLANRIGLKKQAQQAIKKGEAQGILKPDFARLQIADSQQLGTARTITKLVEGLAWFFTVGTLALFALAAYLAGRGRRWVVVLGYGLGLIAAGLVAVAVRAALKGPFVDSLAPTQDARVPAEHAWDIGTSLLQSIATSVVVFGIGFVIASYLSSPAPQRYEHPPGDGTYPARSAGDRLVDLRGPRPAGRAHLAAQRNPAPGVHPAVDRAGGSLARGGQADDRPRVPGRQEGRLDEVDAQAHARGWQRGRQARQLGDEGVDRRRRRAPGRRQA